MNEEQKFLIGFFIYILVATFFAIYGSFGNYTLAYIGIGMFSLLTVVLIISVIYNAGEDEVNEK